MTVSGYSTHEAEAGPVPSNINEKEKDNIHGKNKRTKTHGGLNSEVSPHATNDSQEGFISKLTAPMYPLDNCNS